MRRKRRAKQSIGTRSAIPNKVLRGKPAHIKRRLAILNDLIKNNDDVLDIGCGVGSYITNVLGYLPIQITATDYDDKSVEYAKQHNAHPNVEYIFASGETFHSVQGYDVVICSHVLEHSLMPKLLLHNMLNLLDDNGELFLAIPNGYGCFELENLIPRALSKMAWGMKLINFMRGNQMKDSLNNDNPHAQHFTIGKITELLEKTGWRIVKHYKEQVIGGVVTDRTILKIPLFAKLNLRIADWLPAQMANGWIFICQKKWL